MHAVNLGQKGAAKTKEEAAAAAATRTPSLASLGVPKMNPVNLPRRPTDRQICVARSSWAPTDRKAPGGSSNG